jgi:2-C-methyl-D-erythritol 2,4-cyclodiphosphate synthase
MEHMETPNLRIGLGSDVHRLKEGLPLHLGGVCIESPWGCDAHSDGDALLHALIDALLGACHLGDIGEYFPPNDPKWEKVASKDMLADVLLLIEEKHPHFYVVNVDAVIQLEAPKLLGYRHTIQANIAHLLGMDVERISVKAKTGEGLAPIGTHEAIATQVVLLCDIG